MKKNNKQKREFLFPLPGNKIVYLIITTICLIVYSQTLSFDLVFCDDHDLILNPKYGISDFSDLPEITFKGYIGTNYFRPIVIASFMIDYLFSGENAFMYHLTNLILHIVFCCLLFRLLIKLDLSRQKPFLGAIIYSVHPIFTNSVAWIVGRNDILFSIFCVTSFLWMIKYLNSKRFLYFTYHLFFLMLAFLSKETALVFPLILTFYLILIQRIKSIKKLLLDYWIYWAGLILIFFLLRSVADLGEDVNNYGFDVFIMNLRVILEFLAKFLLPYKMSVLPTYSTFNTLFGLLVLVLFAILILKHIKPHSRNQVLFGMIWFLFLVLPAMLVTVKNSFDWNEYLDTRAYLPMVGIIYILFNLNIRKFLRINPSFTKSILIIIIVLLGWRTISVSKNYSNSLQFYKNAVEQDESRPLFQLIISKLYTDLKRYRLAELHKLNIVELRPKDVKFNYDLAMFYYNIGKFPESVIYFNRTIDLDSNKKEAYDILGRAYVGTKEYQKAFRIWEYAIEKWPGFSKLYDNLSFTNLALGNIPVSIKYSNMLIEIDFDKTQLCIDYLNYASKSYNEQEYEKSVALLEQTIKLSPSNPEPYKRLRDYYKIVMGDSIKVEFYSSKLRALDAHSKY